MVFPFSVLRGGIKKTTLFLKNLEFMWFKMTEHSMKNTNTGWQPWSEVFFFCTSCRWLTFPPPRTPPEGWQSIRRSSRWGCWRTSAGCSLRLWYGHHLPRSLSRTTVWNRDAKSRYKAAGLGVPTGAANFKEIDELAILTAFLFIPYCYKPWVFCIQIHLSFASAILAVNCVLKN